VTGLDWVGRKDRSKSVPPSSSRVQLIRSGETST
jgi:hypothetical protein